MTNAIVAFSYEALAPDVATQLHQTAAAIRESGSRQISEIISTGQALLTAKGALPHGQFGHWLSAEFGWKIRTAENYMLAAGVFGANTQCVAHLPAATVYRLAAAPEIVRTEVLERLSANAAGEMRVATVISEATWEYKQRLAEARKTPEERKAEAARKKRQKATGEKTRAKWTADEEAREKKRQQAADEAVALVDGLGPEKLDKLLQFVTAAGSRFASTLEEKVKGPPSWRRLIGPVELAAEQEASE